MPRSTQDTPVLTVQVDVDTLKNLLTFYGFDGSAQDEGNIIYRQALPRFAELFEALGIRATFFVVGEDLNHQSNREVVRRLHATGHEIANHTQTHAYHFMHLSCQQKRREIEQAGQAIAGVTGHPPVGFRAPGYDVDRGILEILVELGYSYDSSVMPSLLNLPFKLLQTVVRKNRGFSGYGSPALSLAPNHPYRPALSALWRSAPAGPLWEIPVSCVPYVRLPFYANFNLFTGETLFRLSSALARGSDCNYVFHAVEMLDSSEIDSRIHRHPNARLPLQAKISRCRSFLQQLMQGRRVLLSREFAAELAGRRPLHHSRAPSSQMPGPAPGQM
jgi:peptidoglycan/xylan/chitin deacetylase (PgdA/CDA1 family)